MQLCIKSSRHCGCDHRWRRCKGRTCHRAHVPCTHTHTQSDRLCWIAPTVFRVHTAGVQRTWARLVWGSVPVISGLNPARTYPLTRFWAMWNLSLCNNMAAPAQTAKTLSMTEDARLSSEAAVKAEARTSFMDSFCTNRSLHWFSIAILVHWTHDGHFKINTYTHTNI